MLKFVLLAERTGKISHLMREKDILNLIKFKENFTASAINKVGLEGDTCEAWEHLYGRGYVCSQMCTFFWKTGNFSCQICLSCLVWKQWFGPSV